MSETAERIFDFCGPLTLTSEKPVNPTRWANPDLQSLVDLFYKDPRQLGSFVEVEQAKVPEDYRRLLAHNAHMTVTLEEYHHSPVAVEVLQVSRTATHYSRKIVLRRDSDKRPVLFGIVRLSLNFLPPHVQHTIELQETPLGRVLIENNILRTVKLLSLWEIAPAAELQQVFDGQVPDSVGTLYGRTALIYCDGLPAVELLEIACV